MNPDLSREQETMLGQNKQPIPKPDSVDEAVTINLDTVIVSDCGTILLPADSDSSTNVSPETPSTSSDPIIGEISSEGSTIIFKEDSPPKPLLDTSDPLPAEDIVLSPTSSALSDDLRDEAPVLNTIPQDQLEDEIDCSGSLSPDCSNLVNNTGSPELMFTPGHSPDHLSPTQLSPTQLSPTQLSPTQLSPTQLSPTQLSPDCILPYSVDPLSTEIPAEKNPTSIPPLDLVSEDEVSTETVPATDSGISVSEVFPVDDLERLEEMIHNSGWKVPVEPCCELERLLNAAILLAKTGEDDDNEACQKFYSDGLTNSFTKILTDTAINGWMSDIQGYIFDNSVRLVELICLKLHEENVHLLELLAIVLNPSCKFHHFNASQLSKSVPPSSQIPGTEIFARPTDFRGPKGWLVDLINYFGSCGGFVKLKEKFETIERPSLSLLSLYMKPFGSCSEMLTSSCIHKYLVPCTDIISAYLRKLPDEQLKKETKIETRNDTLSNLIKTMKLILKRSPNRTDMLQNVELLHLQMILRLLQISSFNGKMNALNEINRIVCPMLYNHRHEDEEHLTGDELAEWMKESRLVDIILTDYLHLPQYVEKLDKIFRFMINEKKFSLKDIDLIWDAQIGKHEAIVKNIHDLLAKLAWVFTPDQLDAIFARFQKSWETANHRQQEKLLELIRRLAEDDKEGVISDKVLNVLWKLVHSEDARTDIIDIALSSHIKILSYLYTQDKDSQKLMWIEKCIHNLRKNQCVLPALKHLREMCTLFSECHHSYSYVNIMKQLEKDNTLIQLVISNLWHYLDQAKDRAVKYPDLLPTDIAPGRNYSHYSELHERLDFIRFTLKHANCFLNLQHARMLWNCLQKRSIYPSDIDICFQWFGALVGDDSDIEPVVSKDIFVKNMLTLDPLLYTESGIRCFECYFKEVNENEAKLSRQLTDNEECEMLLGTEYIWRLVVEGQEELADFSIALLKDIYSNVTMSHQYTRHKDFINTCMSKAQECFVQFDMQSNITLARQVVRILCVLREYVCEWAERSSSVISVSHERSWQGIPMVLIAQVLAAQDKIVESVEVLTHSNETLGAVRANLLSHLIKTSSPSPPQLQLKLNNEELETTDDKKLITHLDLKDRQLITARLIPTLPLAVSPGGSSDDSSGGSVENFDTSPGGMVVVQSHYVPWLLRVSDIAMKRGFPDLCDAVAMLLAILPTDPVLKAEVEDLACKQAKEMKSPDNTDAVGGLESALGQFFLEPNPSSVRYKLEIVYSLLMPASASTVSASFRSEFVAAGGIEVVISLLTNPIFLTGADQPTKRSCFYTLARITKVMLTTLCYATLAQAKKSPNTPPRQIQVLQNALSSIPNPSTERILRSVVQHVITDERVTELITNNNNCQPIAEYLQVLICLTWQSSFGCDLIPTDLSSLLLNSSREIHVDDIWLAQELLENLTIAFAHQPKMLEELIKDEEFKEFIIEMVLVCPNRWIRQVAAEQLYLISAKCSGGQGPVLHFIQLLFQHLNKTEQYCEQSSFYFQLLCRVLACATHYSIIVYNADVLLEQEVAWLKSVEHPIEHCPINNTLLEGHLHITRELVLFSPYITKVMLGCQENGPQLLPSLLYNYLFPASKMILDYRSDPTLELTEAIPICQTSNTQGAAYNLIGALCKGCLENLRFVVKSVKEMFYCEGSECVTVWDFVPHIQPRQPKGFVGLKNGGATCYMNAVLQQLYMIPQLRTHLLSLPTSSPLSLADTKLHHVGVAQQVQAMFCALRESRYQYHTPEGFWSAFKLWGEPVNLREQHDSLEFFNALLDNLVEGLKALGQQSFVTDILEGSFADQKICKDCPHRYTRIEPFLSVSVDIRNHQNLEDSLEQYVKGDLLEGNNAYFCERCDKKVNTVKRLCFQKLPNILAIQLKRFDYDWERECAVKFNDYFEFPMKLSMEHYTVDYLSRVEDTVTQEMIESGDRTDPPTPSLNSKYRLVGVVVHSGQASGGHYYSYILQRSEGESGEGNKWYRFDDGDVTECPIEEEGQMKRLCFGGDYSDFDSPNKKSGCRPQKRWWNAYILFYERLDYTLPEHQAEIPRPTIPCNPPFPLQQEVRQQNLHFLHQRAQYSPEYCQFIKHIVLPNLTLNQEGDTSALLSLDLLCRYLFQTGFHCKKTIRGRADEWQDILLNLLRTSPACRRWFSSNCLFNPPNRFSEYLLECPSIEVRAAFARIIVTLGNFAINDAPLSLSDMMCWSAEGFTYPIDFVAPLGLHIMSACLALLKAERHDDCKNLQQFFHVFHCYATLGNAERQQLLNLNVHVTFIHMMLEEGNGMRAQYTELAKMHCVVSVLIRCIDLSSLRMTSNNITPPPTCPYKTYPIICHTLEPTVKYLLIRDNYAYLKKCLEESSVVELEDTLALLKYVCWECAQASKEILLELLYYISSVYSSELRPYLDCLLHLLLINDSWQKKRITLVFKGTSDRDALLDIVQRNKSHHQKRAYQCIKCLTTLLTTSTVAYNLFMDDRDYKIRWQNAVLWLHDELDRRPYTPSTSSQYNTWCNTGAASNERTNGYYLERSNSAVLTQQKAAELLPEDETWSEDEIIDLGKEKEETN